MNQKLQVLTDWIKTEAQSAKGLLVPISGGSDSALCLWLCAKALPGRTQGVFAGNNLRCRNWFEATAAIREIPHPDPGLHQDTMRWAQFLSICYAESLWLVGSRNRSEDILGGYSLGSRLAGFLPLAGVWKAELMELAKEAGVPAEILDSSRQADPDCGRPAEMSAIPLELLDLFLKEKVGEANRDEVNKALSADQLSYLERMYQVNQFKRYFPKRGPALK